MLKVFLEEIEELLNVLVVAIVKTLDLILEEPLVLLLILLESLELLLLVLELLLVQVLELLFALIMVNLELVHLLLIFVLLLCLLHLELLILLVQGIELLSLCLFHPVVLLDEGEVLGAETRVDEVLLLSHIVPESLLLFPPVFH